MALIDGTKLIVHANNTWADSSGTPATPDADGATFSSPGKLGSAQGDFDGLNDNVDYGSPSKFNDITTSITLACWVQRRDDENAAAMLWKANSFGLSFGGIGASGVNKPTLALFFGGWFLLPSTDVIDDLSSHLIVGHFDGSYASIFVDNVLKAKVAETRTIATSINKMSIGSYELSGGGRGFYTDSLIDEVVIWDRGLSYGGVSVGQQATGEVAKLWKGGDGIEVGVRNFPFFFQEDY